MNTPDNRKEKKVFRFIFTNHWKSDVKHYLTQEKFSKIANLQRNVLPLQIHFE